jgi:hypothetical protein
MVRNVSAFLTASVAQVASGYLSALSYTYRRQGVFQGFMTQVNRRTHLAPILYVVVLQAHAGLSTGTCGQTPNRAANPKAAVRQDDMHQLPVTTWSASSCPCATQRWATKYDHPEKAACYAAAPPRCPAARLKPLI